MAESEHDKQHQSKFFSRREASFHLDDIELCSHPDIGCEQKDLCEPSEIPLRQELRWAPKRTILSAKASRILDNRMCAKRAFYCNPGSHLRGVEDISPGSHKSFRIVGYWQGGIWSVSTSGNWLPGYLYFWDKIQEKHIYFQSGTLLSSFSVIHFCALLPIFSLKLYILHFLCYGSSTMYTYMIHDYRIQQFLQTDCHTGFLIVRKWRIPILKTVCFQEKTRWILSADFCRNFIPVSFGLHFL